MDRNSCANPRGLGAACVCKLSEHLAVRLTTPSPSGRRPRPGPARMAATPRHRVALGDYTKSCPAVAKQSLCATADLGARMCNDGDAGLPDSVIGSTADSESVGCGSNPCRAAILPALGEPACHSFPETERMALPPKKSAAPALVQAPTISLACSTRPLISAAVFLPLRYCARNFASWRSVSSEALGPNST